jgi:site-specific recombinase XerD
MLTPRSKGSLVITATDAVHHPYEPLWTLEDGMGEQALVEYRKHLVRRHLQPSTIHRYMTDLAAFRRWLDKPLADTSSGEIEEFLDSLNLEVARSRYRWLSQLHRFYAWATAHGYVDVDPTIVIDRPRRELST